MSGNQITQGDIPEKTGDALAQFFPQIMGQALLAITLAAVLRFAAALGCTDGLINRLDNPGQGISESGTASR